MIDTPGVAVVPPHEVPATIAGSIRANVAKALGDLPEGSKGAMVGIATEKGVNVAFAVRLDSGWQVGAWVGKSGWKQPIAGGVVVQKFWK